MIALTDHFQRFLRANADSALYGHTRLVPARPLVCAVCHKGLRPGFLFHVWCERCGLKFCHECYWMHAAPRKERRAWQRCDEKRLMSMLILCWGCRS